MCTIALTRVTGVPYVSASVRVCECEGVRVSKLMLVCVRPLCVSVAVIVRCVRALCTLLFVHAHLSVCDCVYAFIYG